MGMMPTAPISEAAASMATRMRSLVDGRLTKAVEYAKGTGEFRPERDGMIKFSGVAARKAEGALTGYLDQLPALEGGTSALKLAHRGIYNLQAGQRLLAQASEASKDVASGSALVDDLVVKAGNRFTVALRSVADAEMHIAFPGLALPNAIH